MTYVLEPTEIPLTRTFSTTRLAGWPRVVIRLALIALSVPTLARAQGDGARFYWKGLTGATFVPIVYNGKNQTVGHEPLGEPLQACPYARHACRCDIHWQGSSSPTL